MGAVKEVKKESCRPSSTDTGQHQPIVEELKPATAEVKTENCMVCGSPLEYFEQAQDSACTFCGKTEQGHIRCLQGHYICDACHNKDSMAVIEDIVFTTTLKDPVEISEVMMSHPGLPMLGCQHAYIAAGALLAAIKNEGSRRVTNEEIREVFRRIERQAVGGYCGLTGVCGIAPAIGACFSILVGSRCGKDLEQKITMEAATRAMQVITDLTGPSCCKAYVRASLSAAISLLKERLGIVLPVKDLSIACSYTSKHPHGCRGTQCPYFKNEMSPLLRI